MGICAKLLYRGAHYERSNYIQHLSHNSIGVSINKLMQFDFNSNFNLGGLQQ